MSKKVGRLKSGKFSDDLPPIVAEHMNEKDPEWDWVMVGDGTNAWVILRCFDEGVEIERVAAIEKKTIFMGDE